jgi:hypothetical protein
MKYFLILFVIVSVSSYAQRRIIPFKNNYQQYPLTITTNLSYDSAWQHLISFIAQNSFTGKLVDKATGTMLIRIDKAKLTAENKDGKIDSNTWLVTQRIYSVPRNKFYWLKESPIVWYIKVKSNNGTTSITIDSAQVEEATKIYTANPLAPDVVQEKHKEYRLNYYTTGKFEALIKNEVDK